MHTMEYSLSMQDIDVVEPEECNYTMTACKVTRMLSTTVRSGVRSTSLQSCRRYYRYVVEYVVHPYSHVEGTTGT